MEIEKIKKYHEYFSIIGVQKTKVPSHAWKKCQTEKMPWEDLEPILKRSYNFGIVTGFEDLECIDIDLKVLPTAKEQKKFWNEYLSLLRENILDFDNKVVIYRTKNDGYHILYKCKKIEGNLKLASLKDSTEAIIETRGVGGYIFTYPENKVGEKSYFDINYINTDDRDIIMRYSKSYNYISEKPKPVKVKTKSNKKYGDLSPWDDFNQRNDIFSVINDEFQIVRQTDQKYFIKRNGAKSDHSGYVFKDSGLMYLFSTGTHYEIKTPYNPFGAYCRRYHNDDQKSAAWDLYDQGYGSRIIEQDFEFEETIKINKDDLVFPLDVFPKGIANYILQCNKTLDSSIDFMGCAMLWVLSLSVGNTLQIEVKKGWREIATLWIAIVGKAGIGKTPAINNIIFPLEKINNKEIKNYIKKQEEFDAYSNMSKTEQEQYPEVKKPKKNQFLANDITVEALVDLHQQNENAVGVFKDELAGWFKDMNKYKQGSDLEFWLSTWSGKSVNLNRITRAGSFVSKPLIPILGGIQPSIFNQFYTDENKDNGFLDRILLSYPNLEIEKYNMDEMSDNILSWYSDNIISFFEKIKLSITEVNEDGNIKPIKVRFNKEANKEWIRIFNNITDIQNSDTENEYMKSMLPKQKSYIPRFALLIHTLDCVYNPENKLVEISKESILKAEKLSKYFIAMAKKVKIDSIEVREIKTAIKENSKLTNFEIFKKLYKANKNLNKKEVSEQLGVSLQMIYKYIKKI